MSGKSRRRSEVAVDIPDALPELFAMFNAKLSRKKAIYQAIDQAILALADAGNKPKEIWVILKQWYPGRWKDQGPIKTRLSRLLARRENPSREEFIARWKGPMLEHVLEAHSDKAKRLLTKAYVKTLLWMADDIVACLGFIYDRGARIGVPANRLRGAPISFIVP